jgi:hypothetical protein
MRDLRSMGDILCNKSFVRHLLEICRSGGIFQTVALVWQHLRCDNLILETTSVGRAFRDIFFLRHLCSRTSQCGCDNRRRVLGARLFLESCFLATSVSLYISLSVTTDGECFMAIHVMKSHTLLFGFER